MAHFQSALGEHESSHNYDYHGTNPERYGYYSILATTWAAWCHGYAGTPLTAPLAWQGTEEGHLNQQMVATWKLINHFRDIKTAKPTEMGTLWFQRLAASWKSPASMLTDPATWTVPVKSYVAAIGAILNKHWSGEGW